MQQEDKAPRYVSIDFESYYDAEYSLKKMSTWNYVFDKEKFDAYMVAVHSDDIHFVGPPAEFDWHKLAGCTLVMHNAHFDGLVMKRLVQDGVIPNDIKIVRLVDTADMVVFLRAPRSLDKAAKQLLGIDVDKSPRAKMKGKTWKQAVEAGMKDLMIKYGGSDAELAYKLWMQYHDRWPADEQRLSQYNREACWKGLPLDVEQLDKDVSLLKTKLWEVERAIPWHGDAPTLSPKAIREECGKVGIPFPSSFAATSEEADAWEERYAGQYPWVSAIKEIRSLNAHSARAFSLRAGVREDGTFPYQIKYHGAGPGRFSGGGDSGQKFNMLNMPQEAMFGVDIRKKFYAGDGYTFIIYDYSQVEARLLLWRAKDDKMLERIVGGESPYEAHARLYMGWTGGKLKDEDPRLYKLAKARVLAAGYQVGWERFMSMARTLVGLILSPEEAQETISDYRLKNPRIVNYWRHHQNGLLISVDSGDPTHEIELASGRELTYFNPRKMVRKRTNTKGSYDRLELAASVVRGEPPVNLFGGKLTENEIQATARDLLKDGILALLDAGYEVPLTVYDEYVIRVKEEDAEKAFEEIPEILKQSSPWAKGCPLDVEGKVSRYYTK